MEDIVIRMRRIYCTQGAEFARPELQAGWEEIERLRKIEDAARNLVAQKGRYQTQRAYERLSTLFRYLTIES